MSSNKENTEFVNLVKELEKFIDNKNILKDFNRVYDRLVKMPSIKSAYLLRVDDNKMAIETMFRLKNQMENLKLLLTRKESGAYCLSDNGKIIEYFPYMRDIYEKMESKNVIRELCECLDISYLDGTFRIDIDKENILDTLPVCVIRMVSLCTSITSFAIFLKEEVYDKNHD